MAGAKQTALPAPGEREVVLLNRFQVVALSVDQQGCSFERSAKAAFTLDAPGLPATLLIDPLGREVGRHLGAVKWDSPEVMEHLRRRVNSPP